MLRPVLLAAFCCALALPAAAEETAAATPPAPEDAKTYEIPNPATDRNAPQPMQSITVLIDGEVRSWAPLEKGTDVAWHAYIKGDFPSAVPIFARLADLGHPVAEWLMGNIYFFGQGIPKDYAKARAMFEAAADQGYFAAFAPTAQMYFQGLGVPADPSKAYYWYNIAAAQLPDSAERTDLMKRRESVAAALTPAQVEAAQKRANMFEPKPVVPPDPEDVDWMQE
ncbi:MAG: tetratricopeptide repeat protein [Dongiaceae bacterium]